MYFFPSFEIFNIEFWCEYKNNFLILQRISEEKARKATQNEEKSWAGKKRQPIKSNIGDILNKIL